MTTVFGEKLKIELYGKSHGPNIGVRIDGVPEGLSFDGSVLQQFLDRRAPGTKDWSTSRKEKDRPQFISGVTEKEDGSYITDGGVIKAEIENTDAHPSDYEDMVAVPRPSHADYPAWVKYGEIEPGGGSFSGRLTAPLCVAGGLCLQWLQKQGIAVKAHIYAIGDVKDAALTAESHVEDDFPVVDSVAGEWMKELIAGVKGDEDSIGGIVECMITGIPAGLGEPVFGSLESRICQAVFAVPAVKGIEFGAGFAAARMKGSENNDPFEIRNGKVVTRTNNHGGILGGLASGMPVVFRTAIKPTPSIGKEQYSVDLDHMRPAKLKIIGRHDPCIVPRAVPCIEAAAAIAVFDMLLEERAPEDLRDFRNQIDTIDEEITELLGKRFDVVKDIAGFKEQNGLPVLDAAREKEKTDKLGSLCDKEKRSYVTEVMKEIMAQSRRYQHDNRIEYGLLGRKLGHSYSPQVHKIIGGYEFGLFEREPVELDTFFREGAFRGITVTMPYKKEVMKYCDRLSDRARRCGSVNTIVKCDDGTYYGDNTDYYGFLRTVEESDVNVKDAKAIVLGSGGVSGTVVKVLEDLGADPVIVISRKGSNHYGNLNKHADARIIVNTTPVGMYPNAGQAVIDIRDFPACEAVFDLIYNPLRTKLMLDARKAGIQAFGGFHMLAAQAAKASQLFLGKEMDTAYATQLACSQLIGEIENIVLIGMPGCGKTTAGRILAELTGKRFVDCDEMIRDIYGCDAGEIIMETGVDYFRSIESAIIRKVMRKKPDAEGTSSGIVFAAGGGCVEREENMVPLLENSVSVYLERDLAELSAEGRPVSQMDGLQAVFDRRKDNYELWSDIRVNVSGKTPEQTAAEIAEMIRNR
ncbi:MAG: chorismate synthase [Firmicutes bacterium]|nr:chorismate synthase [Bacillota bacterium]